MALASRVKFLHRASSTRPYKIGWFRVIFSGYHHQLHPHKLGIGLFFKIFEWSRVLSAEISLVNFKLDYLSIYLVLPGQCKISNTALVVYSQHNAVRIGFWLRATDAFRCYFLCVDLIIFCLWCMCFCDRKLNCLYFCKH